MLVFNIGKCKVWTVNFQLFKLDLEKAEEPEIKLIIKKAREFQKNSYKALDCVDHNKLWEILKEMGTSDHLICLLRNLYAGQEATARTGHGTTDWFLIRKGVWDGWMASRTRWTWIWVNSGRWWWTGRPGVLQFMGSQRVGQDWATELNWTVVFSVFLVTVSVLTSIQVNFTWGGQFGKHYVKIIFIFTTKLRFFKSRFLV